MFRIFYFSVSETDQWSKRDDLMQIEVSLIVFGNNFRNFFLATNSGMIVN